jgi:hypothetical protein
MKKGEHMKKNFNNKGKKINSYYEGYVLYDLDLNETYFKKSFDEMLDIHDVFHINIDTMTFEKQSYELESLYALDQLSLKDSLMNIKTPNYMPAAFKLIYFNNNLRGFYYQLNRLLFDESSIKKFILGLEKEYFVGKYKQTGSSYKAWLEKENVDLKKSAIKGKNEALHKLVSFDEVLTKRIRAYIDTNNLTLTQFFAGVIGTYYKRSQHKDLLFKTNLFEEDNSTIGNLELKQAYGFKRNPDLTLKDFVSSNWKSLDKRAYTSIIFEDRYGDIKGNHIILPSKEIKEDIEFRIKEYDWEVDLYITFKKFSFKKDEIFLMLNKLRMIVFATLESDQEPLSSLNLVTKKEMELAYTYSNFNVDKEPQSISRYFEKLKDQQVIIENDQNTTISDLKKKVDKMKKGLGGLNKGQVVSLLSTSLIDQLACYFACQALDLGFTLNGPANQLKKKLFGYKLIQTDSKTFIDVNYVDANPISNTGYAFYIKSYLNLIQLKETDTTVTDDFYGHLIPSVLSGSKVVIGNENQINKNQATYAVVAAKRIEDYKTLQKAFVDEKVKYTGSCKLFAGYSSGLSVPYFALGSLTRGHINQLKPVEGVGLMILNNEGQFTQATEKGHVYAFGPGIVQEVQDMNIDKIEHSNIHPLNVSAKIMYDGQLRLY